MILNPNGHRIVHLQPQHHARVGGVFRGEGNTETVAIVVFHALDRFGFRTLEEPLEVVRNPFQIGAEKVGDFGVVRGIGAVDNPLAGMYLAVLIGIIGENRAVTEQVALDDGEFAVVGLEELQLVNLFGAQFARVGGRA